MKSIILATVLIFVMTGLAFSAETTKVCVDVKDKDGKVAKDAKGNPKQTCKEMKVHAKLDGTKIPDKK